MLVLWAWRKCEKLEGCRLSVEQDLRMVQFCGKAYE
jgi:hypothetical protein